MNKRNKIILIVLFFFIPAALGLSLFLFSDEEALVADSGNSVLDNASPKRPSGITSDATLKKTLPPTDSSSGRADLVLRADTGAAETKPYVSYPETLFELLGIDMEDLLANRDAFKNTIIHVEWMDRVNAILKNLDPQKRAAIIKNQATLLYIKDKLNEAYLKGEIDHETFIKALADLMKWHQKTYESMLTSAEYEALFEISPENVDDTIDALLSNAPEYSFILNQEIPVEEVTQQVQGYKLEEVNSHFKKMVLDRDNIGKQINTGAMTLEQARESLNKSQQAFIAKCKEILTIDEINAIFGSLEALETGATQTQAPAVDGDEDIVELGFRIENPTTSVDNVRDKIDKDKLEDIRFFYQERDAERQELIGRLDAGEITSEEVENISNELDAAFEENCRSILTDEEYKVIFDVSGNMKADAEATPDAEPLKKLTEQEVAPEQTTKEKETRQ